MWEGDGVGVYGSPPTDAAQEGIGRRKKLGDHSPWHRARNLKDGFPNRGGHREMYRQGVSGTGSNADGDAVTLPTPACPGKRDHAGGVKPTPHTVPPVQHDGGMEGSKHVIY